jgi:hypothetical protein
MVGMAGNAPAFSSFPERVGSLFPYTPKCSILIRQLVSLVKPRLVDNGHKANRANNGSDTENGHDGQI